MQTTIGGLATASALSTLSSTEGTHNTTTQGKLDTLRTTANTLATASALSTLASVVGTPSPLSGIHQWFTNTMALMIAQARADAMLDACTMPEPYRSYLRHEMADISSNLRPDRPTNLGDGAWNWTLRRGAAGLNMRNTHIVYSYAYHMGGWERIQWMQDGREETPSPSAEWTNKLIYDKPGEIYRDRIPRHVFLTIAGQWVHHSTSGEQTVVKNASETVMWKIIGSYLHNYTNEETPSESYNGTLERIPYGVGWAMIVRKNGIAP